MELDGDYTVGIRQTFKLSDHSSIFQAAVFAIGKSVELVSNASADNSRADKQLYFYQVPGHKVIKGNEIMDKISKSSVWLSPGNVNRGKEKQNGMKRPTCVQYCKSHV